MTLDMEVRSTGAGPRMRHVVVLDQGDIDPGMAVVGAMGMRWTRWGRDHRGRERLLADGVAIIIRRAT